MGLVSDINNKKHYLFYVTLSYSFAVLRPIEQQIKLIGGSVAWFIPEESEAENFLLPTDHRLLTMKEVKKFNPCATLAPGNFIPDFFPGLKVQVFHGFDSGKKNKFNIRGFFDLYCTQGPNITKGFSDINDGTCEVVETGWSKLDPLFSEHPERVNYKSDKPLILYAPTFSPKLTSTEALFSHIQQLLIKKDWHWLVKLHPKATPTEVEMYKSLSGEKLTFIETGDIIPLLQAADIILSDTSSVLTEFALQEKVVVAYKNRRPEAWMLNFSNEEQLEDMLVQAFNPEVGLINKIKAHVSSVHPYQDGRSSTRVIKAIDELVESGIEGLKKKPLNLIRRLKIRKKLKYYRWS